GNRSIFRNPVGVARGDLDEDGYDGVVTTSSFDIPLDAPFFPLPGKYGAAFDDTSFGVMLAVDAGDGRLAWNGVTLDGGNLAIDINQASGYGSVAIEVQGSIGLTRE